MDTSRKILKTDFRPGDHLTDGDVNDITRTINSITAQTPDRAQEFSIVRMLQMDQVMLRGASGSGASRDRQATQQYYDPTSQTFKDSGVNQKVTLTDALNLVYDNDERIFALWSRQSNKLYPINPRTVRHAITCRDNNNYYPPHSLKPDTYPIKWVKLVYTEAAGKKGHTLTYLDAGTGPDDFVHNIVDPDSGDGSYISEGTLIECYNVTEQWFTATCCGATDDSSQSESHSSYSSNSSSYSSSSSQSASSASSQSVSQSSASSASSFSSSKSSSKSSSSNSSSNSSSRSSGGSSGSSSQGSSASSQGSSVSNSQSSGYDCVDVVTSVTCVAGDLVVCTKQICFPSSLGITIGAENCV